jgi:hypothetical protein
LLAELEADSWQLIRRLTHPPVKKIRRIKKISGATLKTEGQDASPAERNFAPIFTQQ